MDEATQLPKTIERTTPEEIDALVAAELSQLSAEEREKVFEDIHGVVGEANGEDWSFMNSCLDELENHLITKKKGTAYALAESLSKEYVSNKDFCVMFLRADDYDPNDAAERMIQFFELKKTLFGTDKLVKDITLDDLDSGSIECLKSGCAQISPHKDTAGRTVLLFTYTKRRFERVENLNRAMYYFYMSALESPDNQRQGVVCIYSLLGQCSLKSVGIDVRNSLPIHYASIHICVDDETQFLTVQEPIKAMNKRTRVRSRLHLGSYEECQSKLASFGISRFAFPAPWEMSTDHHEKWLQERRRFEAERASNKKLEVVQKQDVLDSKMDSLKDSLNIPPPTHPGYVTPLPVDILFGRGSTVVEHAGNMHFRQLVDIYMHKFEAAGKSGKSAVVQIILRRIKNASGRFLKREDGIHWIEVDDGIARNKIAHAFRNRRKRHGYGYPSF